VRLRGSALPYGESFARWCGVAAGLAFRAVIGVGELMAPSSPMLDPAVARRRSSDRAGAASGGHGDVVLCPPSIVALVYELLDAHDDTARLAIRTLDRDPVWREHLDYIRQLQRVGRESLANTAVESS
jgi:hypothetical protein